MVKEIHEIVDYYVKTTKKPSQDLKIFPYSFFYVYFDQYQNIKGQSIQTYIISVLIIFCLVTVS